MISRCSTLNLVAPLPSTPRHTGVSRGSWRARSRHVAPAISGERRGGADPRRNSASHRRWSLRRRELGRGAATAELCRASFSRAGRAARGTDAARQSRGRVHGSLVRFAARGARPASVRRSNRTRKRSPAGRPDALRPRSVRTPTTHGRPPPRTSPRLDRARSAHSLGRTERTPARRTGTRPARAASPAGARGQDRLASAEDWATSERSRRSNCLSERSRASPLNRG